MIKEKLLYLKNNYKEILLQFKENLKNREYRNKYILIGLFILVNILFINILLTYAFYEDNSSLPIIQAAVGDFANGDNDYTLLVYIEDPNTSGKGSGEYHLSYGIPTIGYTYSGYTCKNNSKLTYNDVTKETTVTINQKETCSIYFNLKETLDITVKVMLEESYGSNTYRVTNDVPTSGYTYSHYDCMNGGTLTYNNETHKLNISTAKKEYCNAYFKKNSK